MTGFLSKVYPTVMSPSRFFRSSRLVARPRMAIISDAAVMVKRVSAGTPWALPPRPVITLRRARSLTSMQRCQVTLRGSIPNVLPWWMWLSMMAASVLVAAEMA